MPGLIAIISDDRNIRENDLLLEKMIQSVLHEDKYKVDRYSGDFFSGARVHLGTFNPQEQPVFNEDKRLCIFMDGKIYDYDREKQRLKQKGHRFAINNDPEFCLHLYEEEGEDFVEGVNGSFVILIYNLVDNKLLIFSDRYGFKPHYYTQINGKFLLAPECKAILQEPRFPKILDLAGIADWFAFGRMWGDKTFFRDIEVLPSGCVLIYEGKLSMKRYWSFNYRPEYDKPEDDFVDELVALFKKSVEIRTRDNYRYGISLSGGLDSRSIIGGIPAEKKDNVVSFSFGLSECDEVRIARKVANTSGIPFEHLEITPEMIITNAEREVHLTDGMNDIGASYIPPVHKEISRRVDVVMDGFTLDLTLGGSYLDGLRNINDEQELLEDIYHRRCFSDEELKQLLQDAYYTQIRHLPLVSLEDSLGRIRETDLQNKIDHFYMENHVRRFTMQGYVLMRSVIEHLAPTADNDLVDLITRIPPQLRRKHYIYRKFLKQLSPQLAAIPYEKTRIRADLPIRFWEISLFGQHCIEKLKENARRASRNKIFLAPKRSYVVFYEWLCRNRGWQDFFSELLFSEHTVSTREYLNQDYLRKLFEEHYSGQKDNSTKILRIATFELFLRLFFALDSL